MRLSTFCRGLLWICLLALGGMQTLLAQIPIGKEFIVTLPAVVMVRDRNDTTITFSTEIFCSRTTRLNIAWGTGAPLVSNIVISAGNRYVLTKPLVQLFSIMQQYENHTVADSVNRKCLVVTADQPVSVQCTFDRPHRSETYMIPPVTAYGTHYSVATFQGHSAYGDRTGFTIMAHDDGTVVTITPTQAIRSSHDPNIPYMVRLDRNQIYTSVSIAPGSAASSGR